MTNVPKWLKEEFHPNYSRYLKVERENDQDIVDGAFMPSLKVNGFEVNKAVAYQFTFEDPFSWAIFTINDDTGEFNVQSDWGNWQHRWNVNHLGECHTKHEMPLTSFLGNRGDTGYVCDKLHYGVEREKYDSDATRDAIKERIIECRKDESLDKDDARDLWDELDRDLCLDSPDAFYFSLKDAPGLNDILHDPWDYVTQKYTFGWKLLQYKLLPFFFQYLRREILKVENIDGSEKENSVD